MERAEEFGQALASHFPTLAKTFVSFLPACFGVDILPVLRAEVFGDETNKARKRRAKLRGT